MNHPKFKHGDRLRDTRDGEVFEVLAVKLSRGRYLYCSEDTDYLPEEYLELYQEPKKKKLYAYKYRDAVYFAVEDAKWLCIEGDPVKEAGRCPEYDIEYPESK